MALLNWSQFKTLAVIISGVIVAVVPASLTYLESRNELQSKYDETKDNATGGYAALAASIKDLQTAVAAEHDFSIRLEARLEYMDAYIRATGTLHTSKRPLPPAAPTALPHFDLPGDFDTAAAKFAPKH
jgi:hypothetical protein